MNWTRSAKSARPVHRLVGVPLAHCERQHVLRYPRQGTFHPLKYLNGLVAAIEAKGSSFHCHTVVERIEERAELTACFDGLRRHNNRPGCGRSHQFANRRSILPTYQNGSLSQLRDGLFDQEGSYPGRPLLGHAGSLPLCAAAAGVGVIGFAALVVAAADDEKIHGRATSFQPRRTSAIVGSGQVLDTIDYARFIGKNPGNNSIYVHTGNSGQGMTHGVVGP